MRVRLQEVDAQTRRRSVLVDRSVDPATRFHAVPLTLNESTELILSLFPPEPASFQARVIVGNVLVASTLRQDRPDFPIRLADHPGDGEHDYLVCRGRLLRDWVGLSELTIQVGGGGGWRTLMTAELRVTAGKIQQEAFEALYTDLANHSAAVLVDVYGKTSIGLMPEQRPGETAPIAALQNLRATLERLADALHQIAHQPAYRLKTRQVREPVPVGQAVSERTLEEACTDPTLLTRWGDRIVFREQLREAAAPSHDILEHRLIAGCLRFLGLQIGDLRRRLAEETRLREERRAFRNYRSEAGGRTWWEMEDLPRIEELSRLLTQLDALDREVERLRRYPFLPPGKPLRDLPPATQRIRSIRPYRAAYQAIVSHFRSYRTTLDNVSLLTRAKSLPVLYEWWCALQVIRSLRGCLRPQDDPAGVASPFRRLVEERTRLVIEFAPDQRIDFEDEEGRLVRLRYQPRYTGEAGSDETYGLLGGKGERTPDFALEIFLAPESHGSIPDLLVVLDAKYTSASQQEKLEEVQLKYGKIGVFRTGRLLSRQVWALTASAAEYQGATDPEWARFCTVDNRAFWSPAFDMTSPVTGTVQAKPLLPGRRSPLDNLLRLLLSRCGLRLRDETAG